MKTKLKSILAGALCAVGLAAVAAPSVTINEAKSLEPWDKAKGTITVDYSLGGIDAAKEYKVAFDITANGVTKGVMNAAAKLAEGKQTVFVIDTVSLFGEETRAKDAKVKVSLLEVKPSALGGVQLWAGGPFFAEKNVGATAPEAYGNLYTYGNAGSAVAALGNGWRLPTEDEFKILDGESLIDGVEVCSNAWTTCNGVDGMRFFGKTPGYEGRSIFFPAAGCEENSVRAYAGDSGLYWSSTSASQYGYLYASYLNFYDSDASALGIIVSDNRVFSARAARNPQPSDFVPDEVVATAEAEFVLGPTGPLGSEGNPWVIGGTDGTGDFVGAWTNGTGVLTVQGAGTVTNLAEVVKDDIMAINVASNGVTGAEADAFAGLGTDAAKMPLTLPDGWQGDLPDEDGNWYGAKVELMAMPLTVRNVRTATHWPWDGKIDVTCDLTGSGKVQLSAALTTNGVTVCTATAANITGETEIDLDQVGGVTNGVKFVWNAKADCPAGFNSKDAKVKVTAMPMLQVTLPTPENGSYLVSNLTANAAIAPISGKYLLPYGAKVGIYIVPDAGYVVSDEKPNPYVIEKVSGDTAIDTSSLPVAGEPPKYMVTVNLRLKGGDPVTSGTVYFYPAAGGARGEFPILFGQGCCQLPAGKGTWTVEADGCVPTPTPPESTISEDTTIDLTVKTND